jgi:hypothetical protein
MAHRCPYCGRKRIRLFRRGRFTAWWHPVAGNLGYGRCGPEVDLKYREREDS